MHLHPPAGWPNLVFVDAFMGGGSVSLYAKAQGFTVLANDLARRCWLVGKGIIENNDQQLTDEDLGLLLAENTDHDRYIERRFVPHIFPERVARFLDQALANLRDADLDETHKALLCTALIRFMSLDRVGGQYSNLAWGTAMAAGQYDQISPGLLRTGYTRRYFQAIPIRLRSVQEMINAGIFYGQARIFQENALDWMPEQKADIAYLDPPYLGSTSYEATYYPLECILAGQDLPRPPRSSFNRPETAWLSLIEMFEAAHHIPTWIFSFGENPSGFSREQLCGLIEDFDRYPIVVSLHHRWSIATTGDHYQQGAKELLIIAR